MSWVDVFVLLLAVLAGVSGWRHGLAVALLSFVGVLGGAIIGVKLAPLIAQSVEAPTARVMVSIGIVVLLVALGETTGVFFGRRIRDRITGEQSLRIDSTLGSILQAITVVLAAWLVAVPLASASFPGLSAGIRSSKVLAGVDSMVSTVFPSAGQLPSQLRALLDSSGFPAVLSPFAQTPITEVGPPNTALASSPAIQDAASSVLKIRGKATRCSRALEGTGFVIAPERVVTNAHVVAGTAEVAVEVPGRGGKSRLKNAKVVEYDPEVDVAVLDVPGLDIDPLKFASRTAAVAADAVVLGYPLDGPFKATPARIRDQIDLRGPDIYTSKTVVRDVYTVRAVVRSGNSGGPLMAPDGTVYGMVFGAATDDQETGYVLTAQQVLPIIQKAANRSTSTSTGACAA
ncbi:MarP family serine protease [Pseudonocardia spinosispora]|uniref:MarP family serine protease n=1 Tax=Pseudonocardia spinosispora TaxID=103441 RepID=UPI00041FC197|nr:MarP family serine protease [Pseudonocardia spinosispora]